MSDNIETILEKTTAAIKANGGLISDLQIKIIADQIEANEVPSSMICIVTGATLNSSNRVLREKRLEKAKGSTKEEKIFNLLTSYKSRSHREKKAKQQKAHAYKPTRQFGSQALKSLIGNRDIAINEAVIFSSPDENNNIHRITIKNGVITKEESFVNPTIAETSEIPANAQEANIETPV